MEDTRTPMLRDIPSGWAIALACLLVCMSFIATALETIPGCGGCELHAGPGRYVAPLGLVAYVALTFLGCLGYGRWFVRGAAIGASVHTILLVSMVASGRLCLLCVAAAVVSFALFSVTFFSAGVPRRALALTYAVALIVAGGLATVAFLRTGEVEAQREAFVRSTGDDSSREVLTVHVFEQPDCGYCRDFRELYQPRLEEDFKDRVELRFQAASAAPWVRRTPTIVIEGGAVFEGLPSRYSDLRSAVQDTIHSGK